MNIELINNIINSKYFNYFIIILFVFIVMMYTIFSKQSKNINFSEKDIKKLFDDLESLINKYNYKVAKIDRVRNEVVQNIQVCPVSDFIYKKLDKTIEDYEKITKQFKDYVDELNETSVDKKAINRIIEIKDFMQDIVLEIDDFYNIFLNLNSNLEYLLKNNK